MINVRIKPTYNLTSNIIVTLIKHKLRGKNLIKIFGDGQMVKKIIFGEFNVVCGFYAATNTI